MGDDDDPRNCGEVSRFRVERRIPDPAYDPAESCEDHLAQTVALLLDGDERVQAIVTIRWGLPGPQSRSGATPV